MRAGLFEHWQAEYAGHVATFPVREDKTPAVRGYMKVGLRASEQLAISFPDALGIGLAVKRNKLTVLDVDSPDENLLADALARFGSTPFVVKTGSGNFQAWYRRNGEARRIRPDPKLPIDILGDGFVVAPPSQATKGTYRIIEGKLDDLDALPKMREPSAEVGEIRRAPSAQVGQRNTTLWRYAMQRARSYERVGDWMEDVMHSNRTEIPELLPDVEVMRIVASAWDYETRGENWIGRGARVVFTAQEVDALMMEAPDAFLLLSLIRRLHWGRSFTIANEMAERMPGRPWARKRLAAARQEPLDRKLIVMERPASSYRGPAMYHFQSGQI